MPAGTSGKGQGTATKHAKRLVLHCNPETQQFIEDALADRVDDSQEHLQFKLNGFLNHIVNEKYPELSSLEAIEDIEDMIFEKIIDWLQNPRDNASYSHSDLKLHNKLWAIVNTDKDGAPKKHDFVNWCRRIAWHRTESIAATEHADIAANNAATKHANPFTILVKNILANDLTPEQKNASKYKLREGASITTEQRSLVNVILRKNLGDARIALFILAHGIPTALDAPRDTQSLEREAIEPMLGELMIWHRRLLHWLVMRQDNPNTIIERKLSDLNQRDWQAERRVRKLALQQEIRDAKRKRLHQFFVEQRVLVGRLYDENATEQRVLEENETGKLQKRHDG